MKISKKIYGLCAILLFISLLGVGYGKWNSDSELRGLISSGILKPSFYLEEEKLIFENGYLEFSILEGENTLYIEGEIYSDFNEDIPISIIDQGSIPFIFETIRKAEESGEISKLEFIDAHKESDYSFNLNIKGIDDKEENKFKYELLFNQKQ